MLIMSRIATPSITNNQKNIADNLQKNFPNIHLVVRIVTRAKGMFSTASSMSAKARLARRMLIADRMAAFWYTMRHTTKFPRKDTNRINIIRAERMIWRAKFRLLKTAGVRVVAVLFTAKELNPVLVMVSRLYLRSGPGLGC